MNSEAQRMFERGPSVEEYKYSFDTWTNRHHVTWLISEMSRKKLERAISYVERGFSCFGQRSKVVSLEKALAAKRQH